MLAAQAGALAQLDQRCPARRGPVFGDEGIGQEHPFAERMRHLQHLARYLGRGGEQIRRLPGKLQARSQAHEATGLAEVERRLGALQGVDIVAIVDDLANLGPTLGAQAVGKALREAGLGRVGRVHDHGLAPLQLQGVGAIDGQRQHLLAQARQGFEDLPTGLACAKH
ncbi:hypothetical protein D3C80_1203700 [compost metagenome]